MKSLLTPLLPLFLIGFLVCSFASAQTYTPTALNAGRQVYVAGINNSGTSVGSAGISPRHAYTWSSNGAVNAVGDLGGKYTYGLAVNNFGQVVGYSDLAGSTIAHAFLYTPGVGAQDLGTLGDGNSFANAINDSAQVVGEVLSTGLHHAFLWTQSTGMQDLGTLSGGTSSQATGINAAGHIVGSSTVADGSWHAFLWTPQNGMQQIDLGPTTPSFAAAINNLDQVAGTYANPVDGLGHAFIWDPAAGLHDLGTLPNHPSGDSLAAALNDSGDVVGIARYPNIRGKISAFSVIWPHGASIQKLQTLVSPNIGALPRGATGINNSGQIVANGSGSWLLTPH
ncbi:MAG TPA: hypothetical protein VNW47_13895 [Terriglobales bacterium]|jgi:probable HAF family extracellular repeat protein|nr:hypothetical protein [Terriglobales bacterium]